MVFSTSATKHLKRGIDLAVDKFRAKSDNSTEEAFIFLELQADINEYLGVPEAPVISVAEAQAMVDAQPAHVTDPEMLVEEVRKDVSPKKGAPGKKRKKPRTKQQKIRIFGSGTVAIGFGSKFRADSRYPDPEISVLRPFQAFVASLVGGWVHNL